MKKIILLTMLSFIAIHSGALHAASWMPWRSTPTPEEPIVLEQGPDYTNAAEWPNLYFKPTLFSGAIKGGSAVEFPDAAGTYRIGRVIDIRYAAAAGVYDVYVATRNFSLPVSKENPFAVMVIPSNQITAPDLAHSSPENFARINEFRAIEGTTEGQRISFQYQGKVETGRLMQYSDDFTEAYIAVEPIVSLNTFSIITIPSRTIQGPISTAGIATQKVKSTVGSIRKGLSSWWYGTSEGQAAAEEELSTSASQQQPQSEIVEIAQPISAVAPAAQLPQRAHIIRMESAPEISESPDIEPLDRAARETAEALQRMATEAQQSRSR